MSWFQIYFRSTRGFHRVPRAEQAARGQTSPLDAKTKPYQSITSSLLLWAIIYVILDRNSATAHKLKRCNGWGFTARLHTGGAQVVLVDFKKCMIFWRVIFTQYFWTNYDILMMLKWRDDTKLKCGHMAQQLSSLYLPYREIEELQA